MSTQVKKQTFVKAKGDEDFDPSTFKCAPYDPRYPNQNQTLNCWQTFVDYQRCLKKYGEEYKPCQYFQLAYKDLCPTSWYTKWEQDVEEGKFAGRI